MSERRPIDVALDLLVYAPVGLALSAKDVVPGLARKGRDRFESQMSSAKVIGRFAVARGQARFGGPTVSTSPAASPAPPREPVVQSGPGADALAIPGYDSLAATQVLPRLEGLSTEELEAVRSYEEAHRGRKTILGRIAQLQS
jgi:hypothetical protein